CGRGLRRCGVRRAADRCVVEYRLRRRLALCQRDVARERRIGRGVGVGAGTVATRREEREERQRGQQSADWLDHGCAGSELTWFTPEREPSAWTASIASHRLLDPRTMEQLRLGQLRLEAR